MMIRKIVEINQELCNGCGACADACHEAAIVMIDGKAKLIKDDYCDGLGDCLPACPTDAIKIIEREANEYDEAAVKEHIQKQSDDAAAAHAAECGCSSIGAFKQSQHEHHHEHKEDCGCHAHAKNQNELTQWPVQIKLVPTEAPFYEGANLLIAADCTAYAYGAFHNDFIKDHATIIGCPKLDQGDYSIKLTQIIQNNNIKSITVTRMQVPCCGGLEAAVKTALKNSEKSIPLSVVTITHDGKIL